MTLPHALLDAIKAHDLPALQQGLPEAQPWQVRQALTLAASLGDLSAVQVLFPACPGTPHRRLHLGHALSAAAKAGHRAVLDYLLPHAAAVEHGYAMHEAVSAGQWAVVPTLLPWYAQSPRFDIPTGVVAQPDVLRTFLDAGTPEVSGYALAKAVKDGPAESLDLMLERLPPAEAYAKIMGHPDLGEAAAQVLNLLHPRLSSTEQHQIELLDLVKNGHEPAVRFWVMRHRSLLSNPVLRTEALRLAQSKADTMMTLLNWLPVESGAEIMSPLIQASFEQNRSCIQLMAKKMPPADFLEDGLHFLTSWMPTFELRDLLKATATGNPEDYQTALSMSARDDHPGGFDLVCAYAHPEPAFWDMVMGCGTPAPDRDATTESTRQSLAGLGRLAALVSPDVRAEAWAHLPPPYQRVLEADMEVVKHLLAKQQASIVAATPSSRPRV
jgi:hypothetical protein